MAKRHYSIENCKEEGGPTVTQAKRTKKKVKKKEYRWRKAEFDPPDVTFFGSADKAIEERSQFTPYMYFKQFVTDEMIQLVA
ncbi:piggyBac transposable element-derived protein 3-like, partial [Scomber scombrus]